MGRDSGYGSGKPRSAANSANRRDKAASAGLRKQAQQRQAAKPFAKAKAKAVADGSYGKIQELGVSGGLKSLAGRMLPKFTGQDVSTTASAAMRLKAYQQGQFAARSTAISRGVVSRAGQNSPFSNVSRRLATEAKLEGQFMREAASRTNPTPFSRTMNTIEGRSGVDNPTLREVRLHELRRLRGK
jgi:hypothetical protein